jgi:hypothetical protein
MTKRQAEQHLERDADELERRIGRLRSHIDRARASASDRREEADASRVVVGDWEDTKPNRPNGDDPKGAVD